MGRLRKLISVFTVWIVPAILYPQTMTNFDDGWKFIQKDIETARQTVYDDSKWENVILPHDWDICHAPDIDAPTDGGGGFYPAGIGWYRKQFNTPSAELVKLHFEGVYQHCEVYVNGLYAGKHAYGYTPFTIDVTPFLNKKGKNTVAVKVDNSQQPNCRWYSGSGIYRHVWLLTSGKVHLNENGVYVTTPTVTDRKAVVRVEADVVNESENSKQVEVVVQGQTQTVVIGAGEKKTVSAVYEIEKPRLWSPDTPACYQTKVEIKDGGKTIDRQTATFGVRTVAYDAEWGFLLNGKPLLINGACVHHDDGVLGAMAFDRAEIRKVKLMKEAGFNLIRTSHNPTTRAFLDACDSIGMLVIGEVFDGWYGQKTKYDYSTVIDSCYAEDIKAMVVRDRNHPSIIAWSVGNEVMERRTIDVVTTARNMKKEVLRFDPTRPVTEALCSWDNTGREWPLFDPHAEVLDIVGYNYMIHRHAEDHLRDPNRVMWQTESYPRDAFQNWEVVKDFPYVIGDIVWTGLDYLGESGIGRYYYKGETPGEHYQGRHFPWHGAYCGDVDITGWRKPVSHYREMLWNDNTKLYLAVQEPNGYKGEIKETQWSVWPTWESWNWAGWEDKPVVVEVYTKHPEVILYLNDQIIASQKVDYSTKYKAIFTIPYQPGVLKAVALENGKEVETAMLRTSGAPAAIKMTADRTRLSADGQDLAFITIEVVDKDGIIVPDAEIPVEVAVSGTGVLRAAASANLKDVEPTVSPKFKTWCGRGIIVVQSSRKKGKIRVEAKSQLPASQTVILSEP